MGLRSGYVGWIIAEVIGDLPCFNASKLRRETYSGALLLQKSQM
jgi:hypothetical protein